MRIDSPQSRRDGTPFIGRRQERELLHAALDRGVGLSSLTGPSGIGKTRLARQLAAERFDLYQDEGGVWFCSLAGCKDAADLELTVARTLEIHQQRGEGLARSIANRGPLLLILDNADPIADQIAEVLERWLGRCVELQILLTSLVSAGVPDELVLELRPLEANDAVALYLDRAHRAWADRTFSLEEAAEVQELVRRLDQLPLAIELAAARVRILPPRTMLSMFEKRFELLRTASSQPTPLAHSRRGSLFGALGLTWSHLDADEQLALERGAVFEGGFTAEAARAVLGAEIPAGLEGAADDASSEIPSILDALHRKSLLLQEDLDPPRYFLMESVKEYALRELRAKGGWDEAIRRHASHFLGQREIVPGSRGGLNDATSLQWLRRDRENLIAIHQRFLESDPASAAHAGIALAPLILSEGQLASEAAFIQATLEAARESGSPELILAALEFSYVSHFRKGNFNETRAAMEEFVSLSKAEGKREVEAYTLSRLAILSLEQGDIEGSRIPLDRAVELSQELGIPALQGAILHVQGSVANERGFLAEAEAHLVRSVELLRQHGHRGSEVNSLYNLGLILANQQRFVEARRVMQEAIAACRSYDNRPFEAHVLSNLAKLELTAGFLDEAEAAGQDCLAILRTLGNRYREGIVLSYLGVASLERGDLDAAAERLSRAEEHLLPQPESLLTVQAFLAVVEAERHHPDEARHMLHEAQRMLDASGADPTRRKELQLRLHGVEALMKVIAARQLEGPRLPPIEAQIERARSSLASLERNEFALPNSFPTLARLLTKELAAWDAETPPPSLSPASPTLLVGHDLDWFQLAAGQRIQLRSRRVIRRLFEALVRARLMESGVVVDHHELIRVGWPHVRNAPDFSLNRLHYGIWTLRDLGLRTIVQSTDTGYRLDPTVPVLQVTEEIPSAAEGSPH